MCRQSKYRVSSSDKEATDVVCQNLSGPNNITRHRLIQHESPQMLKIKERTKMQKFDLVRRLSAVLEDADAVIICAGLCTR